MPYFDPHWADTARYRDVLMRELTSFPPNAPLMRRPDWGVAGESGASLDTSRHRSSTAGSCGRRS
jgi:hypothetical protein